MAYLIPKPPFVDGPKLFQKNNRILYNRIGGCINLYMCRKFGFIHSGSDGCTDYGRAVLIANIVLNDQNRPDTTLLTSYHRAKIRIKNISSFDNHTFHTPIFSVFMFLSDIIFPSFFVCIHVLSKVFFIVVLIVS